MRRQGAYAPQLSQSNLFFSGYSNPNLNFLSCTGDVTTQVESNQIPSIASSLPFMGLVTLSIGGNDLGFASILKSCVFYPLGNCQSALNTARGNLYEGTFYNDYFPMINSMISKLNWCPASEGRTRAQDCFTLVYQTAYPSFFESYTTQCDSVGFVPYIGGPTVTQALRSTLNQLGQELNTMLAYYIANINYDQRADHTIADFMQFADQGERYAGHRFCREGVTEPDRNNPNTWFFNLLSNPDTTTPFGGTDTLGPASDYIVVDPNSCNTTSDMGDQLACAFSQMVSDGQLSGSDQVPAYTAPESRTKTFHPNTAGFGAVSAEVQQRLSYISAAVEGRGCPSAQGLNLRIVGIGDSITSGYQSSDGQGYFTSLNENLGVFVDGCPGNTYEFIGSQTSGDFHNEGYPGQTISQIQASVSQTQTLGQRPNLILLMAGTNDINNGGDPAAAVQDLSSFIDYLFQQCPDATILVQHIPAIGYANFGATMTPTMQNVIKYNAGISAMVDTRIAQSQRISRVHQRTTTYDHAAGDILHPNDTGYSLIGNAWVERITVVDQRGWLGNPVQVTKSPRIQCANGLFWDPQGQVATGAGLGANLYPGITCID
jgi:lysophospholipase L1-like esterase